MTELPPWANFSADAGPPPSAPKTNAEIMDQYSKWERLQGSPHTHKQRLGYVQSFVDHLEQMQPPLLATKVTPQIMSLYTMRRATRCKMFRAKMFHNAKEARCKAGQPLSGCGTSCPKYEKVERSTMAQELRAIESLFDFMMMNGWCDANCARDAKAHYMQSTRRRKPTKPQSRVPTVEEVRKLVNKAQHLHHAMGFLAPAKWATRYGETVRLKCDPEHMNLEEAWIKVPWFHGKRKGNRWLPIDAETLRVLKAYLKWRQRTIERAIKAGRIKEDHHRLLITRYGLPYDPDKPNTFTRHLYAAEAERLGLQSPTAERYDRILPHGMRRFFSDHVYDSGIPVLYYHHSRGDIPPNTMGPYIKFKQEKMREAYAAHAPVIGITRPDVP